MSDLTCFKAYDIRGEIGVNIDEDVAYRIGRAVAQHFSAKSVVIGFDARETSPAFAVAASQGARDAAADVINIDILNEANVTIDAGEKATTDVNDTVNFAGANNQGLTVVDLSSTTDQVSQVNGAVNGAAQINIESVDFSGMTGSFGVSVTGSAEANTVTGTANADTIVAGSKGLTVNSGKGADTIQFGAGEDTITFSDATGSKVAEMDNGFFTITNFTGGTDNLIFSENDYSDLSGAGAAGAIDSKTVGLLANTSTAMNTANAQLDGSGAVDVSANDAIFFVGTNSAGNTLDVYFVEDDNVVKTATIATAVAAADAVKIGTISIVGLCTGVYRYNYHRVGHQKIWSGL